MEKKIAVEEKKAEKMDEPLSGLRPPTYIAPVFK